jgi:hypothetical protein
VGFQAPHDELSLQGNLWESLIHWVSSRVHRLKTDDAACRHSCGLRARPATEKPTADAEYWQNKNLEREEIFEYPAVGPIGRL